ncbi:MAG: hypothetical protein KGL95_15825, partial [Patescibacteria group bacterium]|nr:hypothetical protein [Patescibacteria group bacterium]
MLTGSSSVWPIYIDVITSWIVSQRTAIHFAVVGVYLLVAAALAMYIKKPTTIPKSFQTWRTVYWVIQLIISFVMLLSYQVSSGTFIHFRGNFIIWWRAMTIAQVYFDLNLNGNFNGGSLMKRISYMLTSSYAIHHSVDLGFMTGILDGVINVLSAVDGLIG